MGRSPSIWTPPTWRSTAARSAAWPITTRASGSAGRTWRAGLRPRSCWPPTWATALMTRARPRRACCAARWPACPRRARAGRVALRADAGYFAGQLARAAHEARISFAIGAKRIAPLWRLLAGIADDDWHDAIEMDNAQVAVAEYCPDWWPTNTGAADPPGGCWIRPRSPPTRGPGAAAPCTRTSGPCRSPSWRSAGTIYAYSFILTNLDVSSPGQGGGRRALVPAPHHGGEHLPRQQARRRPAASPVGISPGQPGLDVGSAARRDHGRLAAPAHRPHRRGGHPGTGTGSAAARP